MSSREKEMTRLAKLYAEYLNGPIGKGVLDRLREGESFTIRSQDDVLRFTKLRGRAVVNVMKGYP